MFYFLIKFALVTVSLMASERETANLHIIIFQKMPLISFFIINLAPSDRNFLHATKFGQSAERATKLPIPKG